MSDLEKDRLNREIDSIDIRLEQIEQEQILLEVEKSNLLKRKKTCASLLSDMLPRSSGGNKDDSSTDWNRTDFEWSEKVNDCLKSVFKLNTFRALQLETINVTMSRLDCMVIMPTGGGKSLCFQLPACIDTGITLVVSPLVSLVEDQLWILRALNINAETLNSSSSKEDTKRIHAEMTNPNSKLKILYVTPEKLARSKMFMNKLEKMYEIKRFNRLVIDEVHCCSAYGHDFRPDYKYLGVIKRLFPNVRVLGLTATATQDVVDDIKKILNLGKFVQFKASFNRANIYYEVRQKPSNNEQCMNLIAGQIKENFSKQSGIVYCFSQKECEQVASDLRSRGIQADCYHAQMDSKQRTKVHERWVKNEVHVIVATIAFGMGIDKGDCRFVIHHSLSKSLENFYQESGRAGRDGLPAFSTLYFRFADVFRQSSMVFTEQTGLTNLYSMAEYSTNMNTCKRNLIAAHFNDTKWRFAGECNEMCDFCKHISKNSVAVRKVNCAAEAQLVVDVLDKHLNKTKEKRLTANKLSELSYLEMNKSKNSMKLNQVEVERLILKMLMSEYLKEDFHFTPYNTICYLIAGPKVAYLKSLNNFEIYLSNGSNRNEIQTSEIACSEEKSNDSDDDVLCLNFDDDEKNVKNVKKNKANKEIFLDYENDEDGDYEVLPKKNRKL